jgi:hypothetical protein
MTTAFDPCEDLQHALDTSLFLKTVSKVNRGIYPPGKLRKLKAPEIKQLKMQGNISAFKKWENVSVTADFCPDNICNNRFLGKAVLGRLKGRIEAEGLKQASGIYNSTLYKVQVAKGALVKNVQTLSDVAVLEGAVVANCGSVTHKKDAPFGNGQEISAGLETGGREVRVFAEMTFKTAATIALNGTNKKLLRKYNKRLDAYMDKIRSAWSIIDRKAKVMNCGRIQTLYAGEGAVIDNAVLVESATLLSSADEPAIIGDGAWWIKAY